MPVPALMKRTNLRQSGNSSNPRCSLLIFLPFVTDLQLLHWCTHTHIHNAVLTQILPFSCLRAHLHTHMSCECKHIISSSHSFLLSRCDRFTCKLQKTSLGTQTHTHSVLFKHTLSEEDLQPQVRWSDVHIADWCRRAQPHTITGDIFSHTERRGRVGKRTRKGAHACRRSSSAVFNQT